MGFYYNNVASDATSGGNSFVKDPVADFASLPATGNTDGDIRVTLDTHLLYVWDAGGASWVSSSGSGITSLNTLTSSSQTFATGSSGTDFNISSSTSTHTFNIPSASASNRGLITTAAQTIAGVKTFPATILADGGVDVTTVGATLSVGTSAAGIINIGNPSATVNISGTVNNNNVTNLNVTDSLITLNDGGGAGSGASSGIEIEEAGSPTGHVKTSLDRNSWALKAPNTAGVVTLTPGASGFTIDQGSHSPVTVTDTNSVDMTLTGQLVSADVRRSGSTLAEDASGIKVADGGITNTQVNASAAIDASKIADGSVSSTEFQYLSNVTSDIQTQFNNRPIPQAPTVNAWVYVSQQGSDVTGDGTYDKPFATTAAAHAIITDASTSKRYGIHIKGTITETNIYLRPFVWYYGDAWGLSRLSASSGSITLHPTEFASGSSRCGMTNVYLTGSTGISLDFVTATASGSHVIEIQDIGVNGAVVITPNNTNQYFQWRGSLCFSNFTIRGAGGSFTDLFLAGNLVVDNGTLPVANPGATFVSSFIGGTLSITSSGVQNAVQLISSFITGSTTVSGADATLDSDVTSLSSAPTLNSGATLTRTSLSSNLAYSPVTSSDWISPPVQVADALDKLAPAAPQLSAAITLLDNTGSATTAFSYPATNNFAIIEYSIKRDSNYRVGRLLVTTDGTLVTLTDDFEELGTSGIIFSASTSGGNVLVQYVSSNTGFNATLKHFTKKWS